MKLRRPSLMLAALVLAACDSSPTGPTVASVEVSSPSNVVRVGETLQLSASARDASGGTIEGQTFDWSSSNAEVASVSGDGAVTGVTEGQATITAEIAGITGQVVLTVVNPPSIASVSPSVLRPGEEFTVTGERFDPTPGNNDVLVFGAQATVLESSESSLTARVSDFVCGPEGLAPVVVAVGGQESLPFDHPFEPDEVRALAPGEFVRIAAPEARCLTLDRSLTGATYLVGVQSVSGVPSERTPVRIRGFRGELLASPDVAAGRSPGGLSGGSLRGSDSPGPRPRAQRSVSGEVALRQLLAPVPDPVRERWTRHAVAEQELRAREERELWPMLRAGAGHAPMALSETTHGATVPPDVEEGDTVSVRIADLNGSLCNDFQTVQTVARRVGSHSVWLDDVANPSGGLTPEDFLLLSDDFDDEIYEELEAYFGEPTDLDDNGRIVVVVSRRVNEMSANTLGFVVSSDFVPDFCDSSNGGEFYYIRTPDPEGTITDPDGESLTYTRLDALSDGPRLLAHEVTHIIQFGRRILDAGASLEERWLMEGQAVFAEEVVGHRFTGHGPGENLGHDVALYGRHPPRDTVSWYENPFIDLALYYGVAIDENDDFFKLPEAPHACGWLDLENPEPCISGRIGYGVTWSLLRWLSDHVVDDEREFQQRIVESTASGLGTLTQALGTDVRPLMARWAASHYTDGRLSGGDPLLSFPSWDLRSIENRLVEPARLAPEEPGFQTFERALEVAAGSSTYQLFRAASNHPPFAVSALTPGGQELPQTVQLWVVRLQ